MWECGEAEHGCGLQVWGNFYPGRRGHYWVIAMGPAASFPVLGLANRHPFYENKRDVNVKGVRDKRDSAK